MSPPLVLLGVLAVGALLTRKKAKENTNVISSMIDPSELYSPNASLAAGYIDAAVRSNSRSKLTETARVLEVDYRMPKTAANVRAWLAMMEQNAQHGGTALVAGDIGYGYPRSDHSRRAVPDWLRFHATQSKYSGDPNHIKATARAMAAAGFRREAKVHIQQLQRLGKETVGL